MISRLNSIPSSNVGPGAAGRRKSIGNSRCTTTRSSSFNPPPYMPAKNLLRYRVPFGFLFALWYLWLAHAARNPPLRLCAVFVLVGCALRSWAAGYLLKGKRVAVGGPYAFVRNPLYVGSFILGAGFCLALY